MKKFIALILSLTFVLALVGCSNDFIKGIDETTELEVIMYELPGGAEIGTVVLTEEESIQYIVDNLNSLKLKKMDYNEPTTLEYKLNFCSSSNKTIATVYIPAQDWIGYGGDFHSITSGEFDRDYLAGLFESEKSAE